MNNVFKDNFLKIMFLRTRMFLRIRVFLSQVLTFTWNRRRIPMVHPSTALRWTSTVLPLHLLLLILSITTMKTSTTIMRTMTAMAPP